ncbi:MAG: alanine racemase [Planctomycetes bacterium]|nr:alanine racemase [Planctomycetota bacterium]
MKKHRVWAEIDLDALATNVRTLRQHAGPGVNVLAVVKADGYGHGAAPCARVAIEAGASMVGVGDSTEALELREAGILAPILVLGAVIEEEIGWVVSYDITPTIHSAGMVPRIAEEARRQGKRQKVHLKIDTGMGRLGASAVRALEIAQRIVSDPNLELEGLSTHFSSSYGTDPHSIEATREQVARFDAVAAQLAAAGIRPELMHLANSGGAIGLSRIPGNMIRPGIALYGIDPGLFRIHDVAVKPVLSLRSQVAFLKGVRAGTTIGYGRTHLTRKKTHIATLPVGYNDGYPYMLSNRGCVLIRGEIAPVVGTVTMDYLTVDVGNIPGVQVGDEVVLLGRQGAHEIKVMHLAELIGTIPLEITCGLGKRVRRVYVSENRQHSKWHRFREAAAEATVTGRPE